MPSFLSRRQFLAGATVLGAAGSPPGLRPGSAFAGPASANLVAGRRTIEVNGTPASVFGILQKGGASGLILEPRQRFQLGLENQAGEPMIASPRTLVTAASPGKGKR